MTRVVRHHCQVPGCEDYHDQELPNPPAALDSAEKIEQLWASVTTAAQESSEWMRKHTASHFLPDPADDTQVIGSLTGKDGAPAVLLAPGFIGAAVIHADGYAQVIAREGVPQEVVAEQLAEAARVILAGDQWANHRAPENGGPS